MNQTGSFAEQMQNVPNRISAARLVLSVAVFVLIPLDFFLAALVIFLVAAGTDWIDGWYARKYQQVTQLGRILDPFCDKILICGTFILLAVAMRDRFAWFESIAGWMAVVVVGRELLVTVIRSLIEGRGGDFSARMAGKLKMVFQCGAVVVALISLHWASLDSAQELPGWWRGLTALMIWLAVLSTLHSGWLYVLAAIKMLDAEPSSDG